MSTFFSLCALSEGASRGRVPPKSGYKDRDGDRDRGREIKRETEKRQKNRESNTEKDQEDSAISYRKVYKQNRQEKKNLIPGAGQC